MNDGNIIKDDHYYLTISSEINNICQWLRPFGIGMFSYLRRYNNLSEIYFSTNPQWIKDYYNLYLYKSSVFSKKDADYGHNLIVWPPDSPLPIYQHARLNFNSAYGVTFITKSAEFTNFYFFSTPQDNWGAIDFYIHNQDIFMRFALYFEEQAQLILRKAKQSLLILPESSISLQPKENVSNSSVAVSFRQEKINLFKNIKIKKYVFKDKSIKGITISSREVDCLLYFIRGLSCIEIAEKLFLSPRTVEFHLAKIREKFNCKNKFDLLALLKNTELHSYAQCLII